MDYQAMTVVQLRDHANKNNIDIRGLARKEDIINAIQAAASEQNAPTGGEEAGGGTNTPPEGKNAVEGQNNAVEGETKTDDEAETEQDPDGAGANESKPAESVIEDPENVPEAGENVIARRLLVSRALMTGDDVTAVHARLEEKGISVGSDRAAGIYGAKTAYAVRVFQARNRLIVDGRVGKFTAAALGFEWKG